MTTVPSDDAFYRFLIAEGLLDDATIASGGDRGTHVRRAIDALPADVLAAARERFAARDTSQAGPTVPSPKAGDPLLGRTIGGCRIERLLGAGGMGAVYRATQLSIDRPVAFKVQKGEPHPDLVERFRSEARLLGKLHSPHIVDVYDVGAESGLQYFVMEFMPGGSLTSHVRALPDGKLPHDEAARMLTECCLGLAEAAEHGVLHRDIKPDNLLLDARGTVKIADFGIAKLLDAEYGLTQTGFSPGTPAFKSPEQVAASELDFRTDMYSLGVSFWMLLTGVRPADSLTRQEQLEQLQKPLPFSAPEIDRAGGDPLLLTICRMMALKRNDRFASWQELIDTLRTLDGALPAARTGEPTAAPATGSRRWLAIATVAVVAVIAIAAWPRGDSPADHDRAVPRQPAATNDGGAQPEPVGEPRRDATPSKPPAPSPGTEPTHRDPPPPAADPNAAARQQFFAELAAPLPSSPRRADEVEAQLSRLRANASTLQLTADPTWSAAAKALAREQTAAAARDDLRRVTALSTFEQAAQLRAAAQQIELPAYRDDCLAHVQQLVDARPSFLRVADADLAWLRGFAEWDLADDNTTTANARALPLVVRDTRRGGARMVLLRLADAQPSYLDATEVSLGQWRARGRTVDGLQGPTDDDAPVRNVDPGDVDAFLKDLQLRLPTVAELRLALGTRDGDRFWWGNTPKPPDGLRLNLADLARHRENATAPYLPDVDDGIAAVAPVDDERFAQGDGGRFRHLLGNVTETCLEDGKRVFVGGSFLSATWDALQAAQRTAVLNAKRQDIGFRAAHTVGR